MTKARRMNPDHLRPGPIRRTQLSDEFVQRIDAVSAAVAEVCALTEADWRDAFLRDANPERELLWWERVAACYVELVALRSLSPEQRKAAFSVIFGLFSGLEVPRLHADLEKLPEYVMGDLANIVQQVRARELRGRPDGQP